MLEEKIGGIISSEDIPKKAVIRKGLHGDIAFSILDTIYDACYSCLKGDEPILIPNTITRKPIDTAIKNFKLFNLLKDVDAVIVNNSNKPQIQMDLEAAIVDKYIDKIVPKYFRYNTKQIDCCRILNGTLGELDLIASSFSEPLLLKQEATLRDTKSKYIVIVNEVTMLKNLIFKFKLVNEFLYTIMQNLYKLGAEDKAPIEILEVDL